ncbi:hypothetical protein [Actinoplanes sp. URMC 104]|uniref:hypothetical protein n=1 Tax=Actinoplanes sp. URMC 104 TaxID=3423409 RepID=UPI003F1DBD55
MIDLPSAGLRGRPLIAADLDRTLIYSAAALGLAADDPDPPRLTVAEIREGQPLSYYTRTAGRLLDTLDRTAPFVPVTTRTMAQFRRVRLTERPARFAIVANGAQILVDGQPDAAWTRHVSDRVGATCASLAEIRNHLGSLADLARLHTADDFFCYAIVERAELPPALLDDLTGWAAARGWVVSLQGRKLYCLPELLTKQAAVTEIAGRLGCDVVLAAGDSVLDRDLLAAADYGVRPAHGELHEGGWQAQRVKVTAHSGVRAGEEIAAWLLNAALTLQRGHPGRRRRSRR